MQERTDVTEQSAPGGGAATTGDGCRAGGLEGEFSVLFNVTLH